MPLYIPSPIRILGSSGVAVSCPVDTTEDTLATITVPAGAMGLNGLIRLKAWYSFTNSANNKTMRIRYTAIGGTVVGSFTATTTPSLPIWVEIQNANSASVQVAASFANNGSGTGIVAPQALAVDTTAATTIVITGQKALNSETLTLSQYLVELILP